MTGEFHSFSTVEAEFALYSGRFTQVNTRCCIMKTKQYFMITRATNLGCNNLVHCPPIYM